MLAADKCEVKMESGEGHSRIRGGIKPGKTLALRAIWWDNGRCTIIEDNRPGVVENQPDDLRREQSTPVRGRRE